MLGDLYCPLSTWELFNYVGQRYLTMVVNNRSSKRSMINNWIYGFMMVSRYTGTMHITLYDSNVSKSYPICPYFAANSGGFTPSSDHPVSRSSSAPQGTKPLYQWRNGTIHGETWQCEKICTMHDKATGMVWCLCKNTSFLGAYIWHIWHLLSTHVPLKFNMLLLYRILACLMARAMAPAC